MENKTTLKFYSGLDSIGGVILEIKYNNHRILLEMGAAFNPAFDLFDNHVEIRNTNLKDNLWINNLPNIDGLFDSNQISSTNLISAQDSKIHTSVLLTHLHLDHIANMGFVSDDVDVYLDSSAQIIEQALEDINEGVYSLRRHYKDIEDEMTFGDIKVKSFVICDKSYKDYSFYVETPDLKLHYTGDIFVYGEYEEGIKKELEYIKEKNVDILVSEGTSFLPSWLEKTNPDNKFEAVLHPDNVLTEQEMLEATVTRINDFKSLVIFNVYDREMAHMQNWFDIAKETGRTLVFEPKTAYIMNKFFNDSYNVMIPDTYSEIPEYLTEVKHHNTIINKEDVLANLANYLVQNSYENILELLDYRHIETLYMHHSGMPLGDYDPQFARMMTVLNKCNIKYEYMYTFNGKEFYPHAVADQLLWYIKQVNPKLLVPSHCPNRKLEAELSEKPYCLCQLNKTYYYDNLTNSLKEVEADEY